MKTKLLFVALLSFASITSSAQYFTLSGGYSPTFESYSFGLGFGGEFLLMDYQLGFSDQMISLGVDLQFSLTGNESTRSRILSNFYLGAGGELFLADDIDSDGGYALYGMASVSLNQFVISYGYGIYEYDGVPLGELDGYHKLKLTIIFADMVRRRVY